MNSQLKKGIIDICILKALTKCDSYGYQIIKEVSHVMEITESTLYPVLKRLEKNQLVELYTVEHNFKLRKYYKITPSGFDKIEQFKDEWNQVIKIYEFIMENDYE